jgi:hypothetical protein
LDRKGPLPLSDDHEKALQFGVASQVPTIIRGWQLGDRFVSQQDPDVGHEGAPKRAKTVFKRLWQTEEFEGLSSSDYDAMR